MFQINIVLIFLLRLKLSESFWEKDRLVTHIIIDLYIFKHFSPVANFGYQSLYLHSVKSGKFNSTPVSMLIKVGKI